ncbi:hypothetical protein [Terribacillus saccharophilus]|uniref:hypothetical protein n=1 Tax=Terribacillus saccharophilus TaxID=361277 RepID=UPI000BA61FE4|nr:hypothetical protein [Terribacillus saccharophilus]PAF19724.1 hypothetical protein CHH51_01285 [Terribacillus saccharophilus]
MAVQSSVKVWYKCVFSPKKNQWRNFTYLADNDAQAIEKAKNRLKTEHKGRNVSKCFIEKHVTGQESEQIYYRR